MTTRRRSRVFAATREVRRQIMEVANLPSHPVTALDVATNPQTINQNRPNEWVTVVNEVGDDAAIEWVAMPTRRDERFSLRVVISSAVAGRSVEEVEERLEELADVVQDLWFDVDTGRFTPPSFGGEFQLRGVEAVTFGVWPSSEGFEGQAEIVLGIHARI